MLTKWIWDRRLRPVLAGVPVSEGWARSLLWMPSWGFYILP